MWVTTPKLSAGSGQSAQRELEAVASVLPGDKDSSAISGKSFQVCLKQGLLFSP